MSTTTTPEDTTSTEGFGRVVSGVKRFMNQAARASATTDAAVTDAAVTDAAATDAAVTDADAKPTPPVTSRMREVITNVRDAIMERPITAVAIAFGFGYALMRLLRR